MLRAFPSVSRTVTSERLPAYSGATVPASHRLPAQTLTERIGKGEASLPAEARRRACVRLVVTSCCCCAGRRWRARSPPTRASATAALRRRSRRRARAFARRRSLSRSAPVRTSWPFPRLRKTCRRRADCPRSPIFNSVDAERSSRCIPTLVLGIPSQARLLEPLQRAGIRVVLHPRRLASPISLRACARSASLPATRASRARRSRVCKRETAAAAVARGVVHVAPVGFRGARIPARFGPPGRVVHRDPDRAGGRRNAAARPAGAYGAI